jgi:hypothetical protein
MIEQLVHSSNRVDLSSIFSDQQNKRKRESSIAFTSSLVDADDYVLPKSHKRVNSRSTSPVFATASDDHESREAPVDDIDEDDFEEEMNLVNAYRTNSIFRREDQRQQQDEREEGATLIKNDILSSSKHQEAYEEISCSPVSSFFHPAILRATTICESTSELCYSDPPEIDSRPASPCREEECEDRCGVDEFKQADAEVEAEQQQLPSWLTAPPPPFNWSLPKGGTSTASTQLFGSTPWTGGMFHLGSSS